jgi:hypothetical protein
MLLQTVVPTAAAISSLVLAALALTGRSILPLQWAFALGMVGFAVESTLGIIVLTVGDANGNAHLWLTAINVAGILLLIPWGFFVVMLARLQGPSLPRGWRIALSLGVVCSLSSAAAINIWPAFGPAPATLASSAATLLPPARAAAIVQLLTTVGILAGLEACLRTSWGESRRRVKYLALGLGGIFLIRFYVLSQVLLFQTVTPIHFKTMCATLFLANLFLALPIARDQLKGAALSVSREMVYRSVVVVVLGLYLFTVGVLGSLLTYFAIPEETFWASVVVFVSALGLTATLLSDDLRRRLQRFIALHFYRSKYDYRQQWIAFTNRVSSVITAGEIARQLIDAVAEASGAVTAAIYLTDTGDARHRLHANVGPHDFPLMIERNDTLPAWLKSTSFPTLLPDDVIESLGMPPATAATAVALRWRQALIGFIVMGPDCTGKEYMIEDFEFLATVAELASASIMTARLSESMTQARELETFDRVTATVLHDIKNSVAALSLLSRNAARNFDDPEFRRDTIMTLERTVDRMRRLIGKLSSPVDDPLPLQTEPIELGELIAEATTPLAIDSRVRLVRDLGEVVKVNGDREALLRIIENLVTNAVEAIDGEGTVSVRLSEESGRAVIRVRDTGCGIPPDFVQRQLFTPFRSTKKGGWGIGLYQTKQVVERHFGDIRVESVEGLGTTFTVSLPLSSPTRTAAWETVR